MFRFTKTADDIRVGEMSLKAEASRLPTPFYLYDLDGLESQLKSIALFMKDHPKFLVCYALKANPEPEICKRMIHAGLGFDVVSGGEITHLRRLGAHAHHMFFSGVGKTIQEIDLAIHERIGGFNIESLAELHMIQQRAATLGIPTKVGIRWNPDTQVNTHPHLRTGAKEDKFGLETPQVLEALSFIQRSEELSFSGLHVHIGSQILDLSTFKSFHEKSKKFAQDLIKKGFSLEYLNVGGGLGIYYDQNMKDSPDLLQQYLAQLNKTFDNVPYPVVTELGRAIIGIYGALISRVLYAKSGTQKNFLICDASMTELLRPMLYGARHPAWILQQSKVSHPKTYELTSPICESGDVFSENLSCPTEPTYGDLVVILGAGAYGACMASRYNLRPLPPAKFVIKNKLGGL